MRKANRGTYLLLLHLDRPRTQLAIGRLGCFDFAAGYYYYVGSAFGSGGLPARLKHHQRRHKARPHWHIDYVRAEAELHAVWSVVYPLPLELSWCAALGALPHLRMPVRGFGASDSSAPAHLLYSADSPNIAMLNRALLHPLFVLDDDVPAVQISIDSVPVVCPSTSDKTERA